MRKLLTERISNAGMILSIACAIHCMAMPILTIALPFVGAANFHGTLIELLLISLGGAFSIYVTWQGFSKTHRNVWILGAVLAGYTLMSVAHVPALHVVEIPVAVMGAILATLAVYFNMRLVRSCALHQH
ncbi:MAG: MerC domain-containing protein [Chitinophagales bacterium]|nr:MerC domain-containing protein [Chitinophagales bacterium]